MYEHALKTAKYAWKSEQNTHWKIKKYEQKLCNNNI